MIEIVAVCQSLFQLMEDLVIIRCRRADVQIVQVNPINIRPLTYYTWITLHVDCKLPK